MRPTVGAVRPNGLITEQMCRFRGLFSRQAVTLRMGLLGRARQSPKKSAKSLKSRYAMLVLIHESVQWSSE